MSRPRTDADRARDRARYHGQRSRRAEAAAAPPAVRLHERAALAARSLALGDPWDVLALVTGIADRAVLSHWALSPYERAHLVASESLAPEVFALIGARVRGLQSASSKLVHAERRLVNDHARQLAQVSIVR